eukprot:gene25068-30585_t
MVRSGIPNLDEIEKLLAEKIYQKWSSLREAFRGIDTTHHGFLQREDFQKILGNFFGSTISSEVVQLLMNRFDKTGDGLVAWDEFVEEMKRVDTEAFTLNEPCTSDNIVSGADYLLFSRQLNGSENFWKLSRVSMSLTCKPIAYWTYTQPITDCVPSFEVTGNGHQKDERATPTGAAMLQLKNVLDQHFNSLRETFLALDKTRSGKVTQKEFGNAVKHFLLSDEENLNFQGLDLPALSEKLFQRFDLNGNGVIDYSEFMKVMSTSTEYGLHLDRSLLKGAQVGAFS